MTLKNLAIAFAAMFGACISSPLRSAAISANSGLQLIDLTGDFDRVWTETKDLPDVQRVDTFETRFAKILPGFYSAQRVKDFMTPEKYRAFVLKGLKAYPEQREESPTRQRRVRLLDRASAEKLREGFRADARLSARLSGGQLRRVRRWHPRPPGRYPPDVRRRCDRQIAQDHADPAFLPSRVVSPSSPANLQGLQ